MYHGSSNVPATIKPIFIEVGAATDGTVVAVGSITGASVTVWAGVPHALNNIARASNVVNVMVILLCFMLSLLFHSKFIKEPGVILHDFLSKHMPSFQIHNSA